MSLPDETPVTSCASSLDPAILREYDIRGKAGVNLRAEDARAIGMAFGSLVRRNGGSSVCIGYDGRISSPELAKAAIEGLASTGVSVENVGLGPTPLLYFAVKDHMADGGIMVTGSHNPPEDNGFKMTLQSGPLFGDSVQEIGRIVESGIFENGEGSIRETDISETYIERILRDFSMPRPLKVAWDAGNGSTGDLLHKLVARLPGEHILLYDDIDGTFPNHHADPVVDKNLSDLQNVVREQQCDLGIAFDGDGDRIGVIDENGDILRSDILLAVYAREVLAEMPGAPIIGDVKCSQALYDEIERLGGQPVMWKCGHSLIKTKMAELKAPLAGELSGHIFFADKYYGYDDALYCAVRLLGEAAEAEGPLSSLVAHIPKPYNTPEIRFEVEESEKFRLVEQIAENLREKLDEGTEIVDIDGVRVITPDGWWLLRPSNTQNSLVTRAESSSREGLERMKQMVADAVGGIGYDFSFPPA